MDNLIRAENNFKSEVIANRKMIESVLPASISFSSFAAAAVHVVLKDREVLQLETSSVIKALIDCARDGLVPDGQEAIIVRRKNQASYMRMVLGVIKKGLDSGAVEDVFAECVYRGDEFEYFVDMSGQHLKHVRKFSSSEITHAYAIATLPNSRKKCEVLSSDDIEKIKAKSATGSVWSMWKDRMSQKSAIHRLFKRIPSASAALYYHIDVDNIHIDHAKTKTLSQVLRNNEADNTVSARVDDTESLAEFSLNHNF